MGGKFGPICTEFPLTIISTNFKAVHIKFYINNSSCNFLFRFQIISPLTLDKFVWNNLLRAKTTTQFFFSLKLVLVFSRTRCWTHYFYINKQHGKLFTIFMKISPESFKHAINSFCNSNPIVSRGQIKVVKVLFFLFRKKYWH